MFSNFPQSTVCLLKKNGKRYENIKAVISSGSTIIIPLSNIKNIENCHIEPGDIIERIIRNEFKEEYEVIDPDFKESFHGIPQHYQIKVKKIGIPERSPLVVSNVNINGDHNKVNQNSVDQSKNITNINPDISKHLFDIRHEIEGLQVSEQERKECFEVLEEIKRNFESKNMRKKIILGLLNALPATAKITSCAALILSHFTA